MLELKIRGRAQSEAARSSMFDYVGELGVRNSAPSNRISLHRMRSVILGR